MADLVLIQIVTTCQYILCGEQARKIVLILQIFNVCVCKEKPSRRYAYGFDKINKYKLSEKKASCQKRQQSFVIIFRSDCKFKTSNQTAYVKSF